jgi:hypothetical protein
MGWRCGSFLHLNLEHSLQTESNTILSRRELLVNAETDIDTMGLPGE